MIKKKKGFTLIELLIAISIISIVILSLLHLKSDSIGLIGNIDKQFKKEHFIVVLDSDNDGFSMDNKNLYMLLNDFNIGFDLRRKLKSIKVEIKYKKTKRIDLDIKNNFVLEFGITTIKINEDIFNIPRIRMIK